MGARPSTFKKGGGELNGVDGAITGYRWTSEFYGEAFTPGNFPGTKTPKVEPLYFEASYRLEGADEDADRPILLKAGDWANYDVSEDELTVTASAGGECSIGASSELGKFLNTLCHPTAGGDGFPEEDLPEDEDSINLEPIIGARVRFGQQAKTDKDGKVLQRKAKKGKFAGKLFDKTSTIVEAFYGMGEADEPASKGTPASKAKTGKAGKAAKVEEEDADTVAPVALLRYLEEADDNKLLKTKLKMKVVTDATFKGKKALADQVIEWLDDDDNLKGIEEVTYSEKKKLITLVTD